MTTGKKIAIVGGGVIGLALAWRLAEDGAEVVVFDAGDAVPAATRAAAGMLSPAFEYGAGALADPMFDLCLAGLRRWRQFAPALEAASGMSLDYRPGGVLGLAFDGAEAAHFADIVASATLRGGEARILNGAAARRREPAISSDVVAALWAPEDAQVDPRLVSAALRRAVKRAGGVLADARVRAVAAADGSAAQIVLDAGATEIADAVVLAAGFAAADIELPVPAPPVFPVKGEAFAVRAEGEGLRSVLRGPGAYLCPKADSRIVIGATQAPHARALGPDPAAIAKLRAEAGRIAPFIADCPELERWAGLRPATPDAAPILGRDPRGPDNFFLALGHYRNGVLLAPETAAHLAAEIATGRPARLLLPFRPDRFPV